MIYVETGGEEIYGYVCLCFFFFHFSSFIHVCLFFKKKNSFNYFRNLFRLAVASEGENAIKGFFFENKQT